MKLCCYTCSNIDVSTGISFFCSIDIDECATGQHNCPQMCINTDGSFECGCSEGYTMGRHGRCIGTYGMAAKLSKSLLRLLMYRSGKNNIEALQVSRCPLVFVRLIGHVECLCPVKYVRS